MIECTISYRDEESNANLADTIREICRIDVCGPDAPDWPLETHHVSLRILHSHPLTNHGTTLIIGLEPEQVERLASELLRAL